MSSASVTRWRRVIGCTLGAVALSALVVSWFIWGPFGTVSFAAGQLNSKLVYVVVFCSILWLPPVAVVCLFASVACVVWRRRRLTRKEIWSSFILIAVTFAFIASFFLGIMNRRLGVFSMFMRGFAGYVDRRTDVESIQNWLTTLDPHDCDGRVLEDESWHGIDPAHSRRAIPVPPSIARLKPSSARLYLDATRRPMVRLAWGSSHLAWGLVVAGEDTTISGTSEAESKEQPIHYELREPFVPGAYIWIRLE